MSRYCRGTTASGKQALLAGHGRLDTNLSCAFNRREKLYYIRRSDKFLSGVQGAIRNAQPNQDAGSGPISKKKGGKKGKK